VLATFEEDAFASGTLDISVQTKQGDPPQRADRVRLPQPSAGA